MHALCGLLNMLHCNVCNKRRSIYSVIMMMIYTYDTGNLLEKDETRFVCGQLPGFSIKGNLTRMASGFLELQLVLRMDPKMRWAPWMKLQVPWWIVSG